MPLVSTPAYERIRVLILVKLILSCDRHTTRRRRNSPRYVLAITTLEATWSTRSIQLRYPPPAGFFVLADAALHLAILPTGIWFLSSRVPAGCWCHDDSEAQCAASLYAGRAISTTFWHARAGFETDKFDNRFPIHRASLRALPHCYGIQRYTHLARRVRPSPTHCSCALRSRCSVIIRVNCYLDLNLTIGRVDVRIIKPDWPNRYPSWPLRWCRGGVYSVIVTGAVDVPVARDINNHGKSRADCIDLKGFLQGLPGPAPCWRLFSSTAAISSNSNLLDILSADIRHEQSWPSLPQRPAPRSGVEAPPAKISGAEYPYQSSAIATTPNVGPRIHSSVRESIRLQVRPLGVPFPVHAREVDRPLVRIRRTHSIG